MRVLLTGGGTAGHINPAIAIANYIKEKEPDSTFLFVGTQYGLEKNLVPRYGYDIEFIDVMGLRRSLSAENIKVLIKYIKSIRKSAQIIKKFRPDVVIGTGGYVCTPVVIAAISKKIPTLIHEQNVFPGLAIKMLSQDADVTAISFSETNSMLKAKNMVLTGNPLRTNLFEKHDEDVIRAQYGFDSKPIVLMFGGSLGAEKMNSALLEMMEKKDMPFNLIAATGEKHYEKFTQELREKDPSFEKRRNVKILPYIYNMEEIFSTAEVIVGRAGAITVSEITAMGKAAVLIPSPYVAHNHQEYNARYLEKNGAAKVIVEKDLSGDVLYDNICAVLSETDTLRKMKESSKAIGITDACETIYNCIRKIMK